MEFVNAFSKKGESCVISIVIPNLDELGKEAEVPSLSPFSVVWRRYVDLAVFLSVLSMSIHVLFAKYMLSHLLTLYIAPFLHPPCPL